MNWLFAICDRPERPLPADVEGLREGALLAAFTPHALGEATPDALWEHERVIERLMEERTVLPMRFGSVLDDDAAVRGLLRERQASFVDLLARVRGRVELGVRAAPTAPEVAANGREYLLAKLAHRRALSRLDPLAVESRQRSERASYLVERRAIGPFRAAVEELQRELPELAIVCTGPWPPFSFMEGE